MILLLIVIIYILICLYEVPSLVKNKQKRELIIFISFLVPSLGLSLLQGAGVKLPYILPAIETAIRPTLSSLGLL